MTVRKIVLVFTALWIATASAAQTDRISGKCGSDGQTLLDLKSDGDATVTGTAYFRQRKSTYTTAIERGSFNQKTGALKLEGELTGPQDAMVAVGTTWDIAKMFQDGRVTDMSVAEGIRKSLEDVRYLRKGRNQGRWALKPRPSRRRARTRKTTRASSCCSSMATTASSSPPTPACQRWTRQSVSSNA